MRYLSSPFIALTPLMLFIVLFVGSGLFFATTFSTLFTALATIMYAIVCTFKKEISFNKRIEIFIQGSAQHTAIATCYILLLSAIFTYIVNIIGGTQTAVALGKLFIPSSLLLPGFFSIVSLFAISIGSSMGAIASFLPIGLEFCNQLAIDPALMCGIVVSGAMLGDNLSIISDTTIAATQTTECKMHEKFRANVALVIPAFLLTIITLAYINYLNPTVYTTSTSLDTIRFLPLLPYLLIFFLAPFNIDVIALLSLGITSALAIGLYQHNFTFLESTQLFLQSFSNNVSIQEVFILILFVAGLSYIVDYNGGIEYIFKKLTTHIKSKTGAEIAITLLVFLVNSAVAINTIAILLTGPVAKHIGTQFQISKSRIASLIDIVACICQGILPYAPQLLLAASLAKISSISIIPYLHYQGFIALVLICSIFRTYLKERAAANVL